MVCFLIPKNQLLHGVISDNPFPIRLITQSASVHIQSLKFLLLRVIIEKPVTISLQKSVPVHKYSLKLLFPFDPPHRLQLKHVTRTPCLIFVTPWLLNIFLELN